MNPSSLHHISDQQLLENFRRTHDEQWLGHLLERYTLMLFGVCMKYLKHEEEAKDAVQQVFLVAISEVKKYRIDYFKSWIYMVAKNHCLMKLRKKPGSNTVEVNEQILEGGTDPDQEQLIQENLLYEQMNEALNELNPEQQTCVTLFYLEKKSYQQISEITGFSLMQIKSYIQNGKRNLRILIEKKMNESGNV